ncbi:uncharacterized protein LOC141907866 isoform X2 [Tubulanus polymorphus]|uniref:uncharacterized protein LOC141907866 isoform X2 n=1 Tax=Tubulanus polymorphus TaxID=672921 RepID=UPI003DA469EC
MSMMGFTRFSFRSSAMLLNSLLVAAVFATVLAQDDGTGGSSSPHNQAAPLTSPEIAGIAIGAAAAVALLLIGRQETLGW